MGLILDIQNMFNCLVFDINSKRMDNCASELFKQLGENDQMGDENIPFETVTVNVPVSVDNTDTEVIIEEVKQQSSVKEEAVNEEIIATQNDIQKDDKVIILPPPSDINVEEKKPSKKTSKNGSKNKNTVNTNTDSPKEKNPKVTHGATFTNIMDNMKASMIDSSKKEPNLNDVVLTPPGGGIKNK